MLVISNHHGKIPAWIKTRRDFLTYILGTTVASVAIGYLFPKVSQSSEIDLETLCSLYPKNSRCQNYLPGLVALAQDDKQIEANALLTTAKPGIPILVKRLPHRSVDYLIIQDRPQIAEYAISPICTHLECIAEWDVEKNHFICPSHGS